MSALDKWHKCVHDAKFNLGAFEDAAAELAELARVRARKKTQAKMEADNNRRNKRLVMAILFGIVLFILFVSIPLWN
jgi:hypothetical protein